mgnify:CR=1 FL=1
MENSAADLPIHKFTKDIVEAVRLNPVTVCALCLTSIFYGYVFKMTRLVCWDQDMFVPRTNSHAFYPYLRNRGDVCTI